MKTVDIRLIKSKFGQLLSFLILDCSLDIDIVNGKIISSSFFDFLENDISPFLNNDIKDIASAIFGARPLNITNKYQNDIVFAGESYISISISLGIPLRKMFLLYPLDKMVELFPVYHEMSPFRVIEKVKQEIDHISVFSLLSSNSNYSLLQLANILDIDRRQLTKLCSDPKQEEKLTVKEKRDISKLFNVDELFFSSSKLVPYYFAIWKNEIFIQLMKDEIRKISQTKKVTFSLEQSINNVTKVETILHPTDAMIIRNKKIEKMPSYLFDFALEKAIEKYRQYCLLNQLAFC